ncbi:nectin-4 isoform X2 [Trichomycterus rosablanca]|uniref:nectin-4 isoform X2 n=1 Tax=Trichomycterus rosablanca TaxID=2290929 RepID=UPI002F355F06
MCKFIQQSGLERITSYLVGHSCILPGKMTTTRHRSRTGLFLITIMACVFIHPCSSLDLITRTEEETRLPCEFSLQDQERVIQVTWSKKKSDGTEEQMITWHWTEGVQGFSGFTDRVRFASSNPIKDSTLLIETTKESDQATYICHISTFPSGNFERQVHLTVWRLPISTLDPVVLIEGQSLRIAATCRAVGLPPPSLSWDTDLPGPTQNKTSEGGVITSYYYLHPLRSMNGRKLDCLVWHPALKQPHRISNTLIITFPPDAVVAGYDKTWSVNRNGAELRCEGGGNPKPQNFTWTRKGMGLPKGVIMEENRLIFTRPLNKTDEGVYECEARNSVGSVKAEVNVEIPEAEAFRFESIFKEAPVMTVGVVAGALVVIMTIIILLVSCHHRRRTRKLKRELDEKKEEINNLSRQNSMRRLNSNEDYALLRMGTPVKRSFHSLEENSTICDQREGFSDYDSLGRPAIYPPVRSERGSGRRRETELERQERIRRVESYVNSSTVDLGCPKREMSPPPLSVSSGPPRDSGSDKEDWGQREGMPEGEEGDGTLNSCQISEALSHHFHYSNGFLRPKPHPNAIILQSHSQII